MDYNFILEDVEFLEGITININVNVYVNENARNWANHGKIFAIEGMAHTANCWKPFAEELFLRPDPQLEINEFYAIDMPGRGLSGIPESDTFLLDNMYLEDYLTVITEVLHYMNEEMGVKPNTIMGHSMGGLEVILLQNRLIDEGTNMRQEFGIKNAILLAPGIPAPLDWSFLGTGSLNLLPFAMPMPGLGIMLNIPYDEWPYVFFTNTCCYFKPNMVPGAPTPEQVQANGYNSIEPGPLLFELSGMPPPPPYPYKPRVSADPDLFIAQNGVKLTIIADEFDKMMQPAEEKILYEYLTGDKHYQRFLVVLGDETCHDTHIADPHAIVSLLNSPNFFKEDVAVNGDVTNLEASIKVSPNPVEGQSFIDYTAPVGGNVKVCLYDTRGALVSTLVNTSVNAGSYRLSLDLSDQTPGVYFLRFETNSEVITQKVIKR